MSNRRSFAKSIASLLMVPLLKYQPEQIDRHKLLGMFLEEEQFPTRWDLTRPYIVGEHSYATEGRIMARIDTNEAEHDEEQIKVPPVGRVWNEWYVEQTKFKPFRLAEIDELEPSKDEWGVCPQCLNRRVSFGPSYPANQTQADKLLSYDPDDNTIRDSSCSLCHGREYTEHCFQRIDGSLISYSYAMKLAAIPVCEVANGSLSTDLRSGKKVPATLFRSEIGIAGIVMPVIQRD